MALCWSRNTRTAVGPRTPQPPEKASSVPGRSLRSGSWRCPQLYNRLLVKRRRRPRAATGAHGANGSTPLTRSSSARACLLLATATLNRGAASCSRGSTLGSELISCRGLQLSCFRGRSKSLQHLGPDAVWPSWRHERARRNDGRRGVLGDRVVDSAIWPAPKAMAASTTRRLPAAPPRQHRVALSVEEEIGKHPRPTATPCRSRRPAPRAASSKRRAADAAPWHTRL